MHILLAVYAACGHRAQMERELQCVACAPFLSRCRSRSRLGRKHTFPLSTPRTLSTTPPRLPVLHRLSAPRGLTVRRCAAFENLNSTDSSLRIALCDINKMGHVDKIIGRLDLPLEQLLHRRRLVGDLPLQPYELGLDGLPVSAGQWAAPGSNAESRTLLSKGGQERLKEGKRVGAAEGQHQGADGDAKANGAVRSAGPTQGGVLTVDIRVTGMYYPGEWDLMGALGMMGFQSCYATLKQGGIRTVDDLAQGGLDDARLGMLCPNMKKAKRQLFLDRLEMCRRQGFLSKEARDLSVSVSLP
jgi:hypothetical protein